MLLSTAIRQMESQTHGLYKHTHTSSICTYTQSLKISKYSWPPLPFIHVPPYCVVFIAAGIGRKNIIFWEFYLTSFSHLSWYLDFSYFLIFGPSFSPSLPPILCFLPSFLDSFSFYVLLFQSSFSVCIIWQFISNAEFSRPSLRILINRSTLTLKESKAWIPACAHLVILVSAQKQYSNLI